MKNRQIGFRVWDNISKQMYYPEKAKYCLTMIGTVCDDLTGDTNDSAGLLNVDYRTIAMQYTGLKDKNGVEIYEGDVVELAPKIRIVGWYDELACFKLHDVDNVWEREVLGDNYLLAWEVIGNIYENPEFLEEK